MKAVFALCMLFAGLTRLALAQDDSPPRAPAPAPGDHGTASQPPVRGNPKTPAAGAHQKEHPTDIAPPEHDEAPDASDPYARDPYETEPSADEGGTGDEVSPTPDKPPVGAAPERNDAPALDEDEAEPDADAEE